MQRQSTPIPSFFRSCRAVLSLLRQPPCPPFYTRAAEAGRIGGASLSGQLELLDVVECFEEGLQMLRVGPNPEHQASSCVDDLARDLNEASLKPLELHPQNVPPGGRCLSYKSIPGFKIPGQSGDHHVGPIRDQTIRRHPESIDPTLQLRDHVLLVATIVSKENHFLHRHLAVVSDVEEVPDVVKQTLLASLNTEVLSHHNNAIGLFTTCGFVVELSNVLTQQSDVLVFTFPNNLLFDVVGPASFFGFHFIACWSLEPFPRLLVQLIRQLDRIWFRIETEDEADSFVPRVQVFRERKVSVSSQPHLFEDGSHQIHGSIHPLGSAIARGAAAWAIDQKQHLVRIGHCNDERRIPPDPVISNIHPRFASARGSGDCSIDVDDRLLPKRSILKAPHFLAPVVDDVLNLNNRGHVKTPQKVSRCGRIRNPLCAKSVHVCLVVPQPLNVFKAGSSREDVVSDVQNMVRLVIRNMSLQEFKHLVDQLIELQPADELVHRADSTKTER